MRSSNEQQEKVDGASYRELRLLEEVDSASNLSQRKLALSLGIALGVVNVLIRKVARKGYVRITQSGWRRWAYVLTPAGMTRKFQLTMEYMESILGHYRKVRSMLRNELSQLPLNPESRVAIIGTTGLAELTYLALLEMGITKIDFFSPERVVGDDARFLKEGLACQLIVFDNNPIGVTLPNHVILQVEYCEPAVKGNTATNVSKPVKLETEAQILAPAFINIGDWLRVDTRTGEYIERSKEPE